MWLVVRVPNGLSKYIGNHPWSRSLPRVWWWYMFRSAFVGSMFSGSIADGVGRCRAFQLCALPMIVGASMWLFVVTGMGISPPVSALYVSDVLLAYVRGAYGTATQIATCLGILLALFIGLPAKQVLGGEFVFGSTIPAASLVPFTEFCAESPHWLFMRGRGAEADFERLLGGLHVHYSMAELSRSEREDEADAVNVSELISSRHFSVVFIGSTLFALQQLRGINAVLYCSSTVFKNVGAPSDSGNICVGIANLSGGAIAAYTLAVATGVEVTSATSFVSSSGALSLSLGGMLLFAMTFSLGAGPAPSLLLSEIFPNQIRAKSMAVCMAVHWVINFLVCLLFLPLIVYTISGSFCFLAVIFVKRNVMETKGKTLKEIERAILPPQ